MGNREVLEQIDMGYRIPRHSVIPQSMYDMQLSCWDREPERRPTFEFLHSFYDDFFVTTEPNYREADGL